MIHARILITLLLIFLAQVDLFPNKISLNRQLSDDHRGVGERDNYFNYQTPCRIYRAVSLEGIINCDNPSKLVEKNALPLLNGALLKFSENANEKRMKYTPPHQNELNKKKELNDNHLDFSRRSFDQRRHIHESFNDNNILFPPKNTFKPKNNNVNHHERMEFIEMKKRDFNFNERGPHSHYNHNNNQNKDLRTQEYEKFNPDNQNREHGPPVKHSEINNMQYQRFIERGPHAHDIHNKQNKDPLTPEYEKFNPDHHNRKQGPPVNHSEINNMQDHRIHFPEKPRIDNHPFRHIPSPRHNNLHNGDDHTNLNEDETENKQFDRSKEISETYIKEINSTQKVTNGTKELFALNSVVSKASNGTEYADSFTTIDDDTSATEDYSTTEADDGGLGDRLNPSLVASLLGG